uniref:Uncharacterized protein n=1 Tax=Kalanchoe fedtschenkoi TaxID=63787 RepID=A0A7N0VIX9_KALFE
MVCQLFSFPCSSTSSVHHSVLFGGPHNLKFQSLLHFFSSPPTHFLTENLTLTKSIRQAISCSQASGGHDGAPFSR